MIWSGETGIYDATLFTFYSRDVVHACLLHAYPGLQHSQVVDHRDGNKLNNHASNLWSRVWSHSLPVHKVDPCTLDVLEEFLSILAAARVITQE